MVYTIFYRRQFYDIFLNIIQVGNYKAYRAVNSLIQFNPIEYQSSKRNNLTHKNENNNNVLCV